MKSSGSSRNEKILKQMSQRKDCEKMGWGKKRKMKEQENRMGKELKVK